MKRYLIYGFLTVLIITLNFAFIIVLVTDDVRINYRVLFLLWLVVILAAAGLAYLEKTRKNEETASDLESLKQSSGAASHFAHSEVDSGTSSIYKNKCLKKFRIKLSEDLTPKVEAGFFGGYITNEEYSNETVQAVYTADEHLLGYINKNKKRLCKNLETLYTEPVVCWGEIVWNEDEKRFIAKGHVPVLYNEPEVNRFKKMVRLKSELLHLEKDPEGGDVHTYLKKAETFHYLQQSEIVPSSLDHTVDPEILPALCRKFSEAQNWEEILKLRSYPVLVSRMQQAEKKSLFSCMKKAEKKQKS